MPIPRHPVLRPGVSAVRRDATHLQVGLDAPRRAVLPDVPQVRDLLRCLRDQVEPDLADPLAHTTLVRLDEAGLVMERPAGPVRSGPAVAVTRHQFGTGAEHRLDARSAARVGVRAPAAAAHAASVLLRAAGIEPVRREADAEVWLLVSVGEPSRELVDPLVRAGLPHLLVSTGPTARVGPFVVPGCTACVRCMDAALCEDDPRRPLVVEQLARHLQEHPQLPVDPALEAMALAWAVRDLVRHVEGDEPSTWSASVDLDAVGAPVLREWRRHPHCGCAWDVVW